MLRRTSFYLGKALLLADGANGKLSPATLSAATAAKKLGPVTVLVAGSGVKELSKAASELAGVTEVLAFNNAAYDHDLPEAWAPLVREQVKLGNFSHVVAGANGFGRNIAPRAAALLDVMPITEVVAIESEDTFVRPVFAGNALTTVKSTDPVKVLTVRGTAFDAAGNGGSAPVKTESAGAPTAAAKWIEDLIAKSDKIDLMTASAIVSGGRGLKNQENFKLLYDLAGHLKGGVGATRAVVDANWCSYDMQIGQTGKIVAPNLYIACGISGAIQHVAGMKDSKVIVAINTDPDAPIFLVSDYGLVQDLFKAVPELTSLIAKK